ncbi:MAG TPA: alcohol dehydrogenase catalytic domain-containing protein [Acidobacteriaceae bacterium]|nr:alcohol dehydrogenase catalytic domain-containing protein [Acidobacteriaceae bacterium]
MIAETMLAGVLHGKEDLRMERIPVPSAEEGELVVRIAAALTCGTDLKVYRRGYHAMMLKPPILFGHELAGTVEEVGPGVSRFKAGDRVLPINSAPCDRCFYCLRGQHNLCDDLLFNNGAYAEYIRIPARIVAKNTYFVPDSLPFEHAALTEPLACVVHGFNETGAESGDTMAVIGAGPIGLMFMHLARIRGLRVIAVVKRDDQVAAAHHFGAADVVQIGSEPDSMRKAVDQVRSLTGDSRGADCVVEAVATPATWEAAVAMVRKGGTVNFFGGPPSGTSVALDTNRLHYGDITLKASFHHTPAACCAALALISSGKFKAADFITRTAALCDLPQIFAGMMTRSVENRADIKTAILPDRRPL